MIRALLISHVALNWPQSQASFLSPLLVPQGSLLWLMLYLPCPYPLGPSETCKQFPYISDTSSVQEYSWKRGVWGGQSAGEFTSSRKNHQTMTDRSWSSTNPCPFPLDEQSGVGSMPFLSGCPAGLSSRHPQCCVTTNTPFTACPLFPVSFLLSLTGFLGSHFKNTISTKILDLGTAFGVS